MWSQYEYSLHKGKNGEENIKFSTIRGQRSAASLYYRWNTLMSNPGKVTHSEDACHFHEEVLPTDDMSYTLMSKGLKRRLGTEANKSQALRFAHIKFLDQQFREEYQAAKTWEQ